MLRFVYGPLISYPTFHWTCTQDVSVAKMPRLVEPEAPSFLNFYVGGPRNATIAKMRKYQSDKVCHARLTKR